MKLPSHLKISRHGIYYFRTIIPKVIRPLYDGKTELKYSLHTRDPVTARRQAYILSAQTAHIFSKVKRTMIRHDPKDFNPLDQSTWPTSKESANSWEVTLANGMTIKTDPNNPDDQKNCLEALETIGRLFPVTQSTSTAESKPIFKGKKLSEGIELFVNDRKKIDSLAPGTKMEEARKFQRFLAWTSAPHDPYIEDVDQELIQVYIDYLMNGDKEKGVKPLSKTTAYNHNTFLNILFTFFQRKKLYPADKALPTAKTDIYGKGERVKALAANAYEPFNLRELELIFKPEHIKSLKKPHEYWNLFLGIYTGARIDEICQLFIDDIRQTNDGHWFIHFHDYDGNSTKNTSSSRRVPVHPDLLSLGFIDYIADVKAVAPSGHLFPYLAYSEKNGFAARASKAFGRYLDRKEINIVSEKKVFHSFRSSLVQLLEDNRVHEKHIQSLIGHASDGTIAVHYGKKTDLAQLKDWVVFEIHFPFIENNIERRIQV